MSPEYHEGNTIGNLAGALGGQMVVTGTNATLQNIRLISIDDDITDGDKLGQIDFVAPGEASGGDAILAGASIWAEADDTFSATVNSTELVFATGTTAAATEKVRIDRDGKVGIGTSAPSQKLDVQGGNINASGNILAGGAATFSSDSDGRARLYQGAGVALTYWNGSAVTQGLILNNSGNVGIGTTAPLSELAINGGLHVGGDSDAGDNNLLVDGTIKIGALPVLALKAAATAATTGNVAVTPVTQQVYTCTPTGNIIFASSGGSAGARCTFVILTSGTTSYSITFDTNFRTPAVLATGTKSGDYFTVSFICVDGTVWAETGRAGPM